MMSNISKKISFKAVFFLTLLVVLNSCQKNDDKNKIEVFSKGQNVQTFLGKFYTTEFGGVNYFISDEKEREKLFKIDRIDSISFSINDKIYISKPIILKAFSRQRNNSDFSFNINETDLRIVPDTIDEMKTLQFFSEKTDLEKMKKEGLIDVEFINLKK